MFKDDPGEWSGPRSGTLTVHLHITILPLQHTTASLPATFYLARVSPSEVIRSFREWLSQIYIMVCLIFPKNVYSKTFF